MEINDDISEKGKGYWSMTEGVYNCLIDTQRTEAFEKAIKNTVKPGDVVVDMGTGSGVLAMFAADAGARKVYAVDNDEKNVMNLQATFSENNYSETIEIIKGDVTELALPEKVDVVIGEMIATALIEELQIPAMNNILKYTKENAKVVLNQYASYVDLVSNNNKVYGHTFPIIRYEYPEQTNLASRAMSEKFLYKLVDFSKSVHDRGVDFSTILTVSQDGIINGLRVSSETIFSDGSKLWGTSAYSYPIILPIKDMEVAAGDKVTVKLAYVMCEGFATVHYSVDKT